MKKYILIILLLVSFTYSNHYSPHYRLNIETNIPLGINSSFLKTGFGANVGIEKAVSRYIYLGSEIGYKRWSLIFNNWVQNFTSGDLSYTSTLLTVKFEKSFFKKTYFFTSFCTGLFWGKANILSNNINSNIKHYDIGIKFNSGIRFKNYELSGSYNRIIMTTSIIHYFGIGLGYRY